VELAACLPIHTEPAEDGPFLAIPKSNVVSIAVVQIEPPLSTSRSFFIQHVRELAKPLVKQK
jgi:hypothetical protein